MPDCDLENRSFNYQKKKKAPRNRLCENLQQIQDVCSSFTESMDVLSFFPLSSSSNSRSEFKSSLIPRSAFLERFLISEQEVTTFENCVLIEVKYASCSFITRSFSGQMSQRGADNPIQAGVEAVLNDLTRS